MRVKEIKKNIRTNEGTFDHFCSFLSNILIFFTKSNESKKNSKPTIKRILLEYNCQIAVNKVHANFMIKQIEIDLFIAVDHLSLLHTYIHVENTTCVLKKITENNLLLTKNVVLK